MAGLLTIETTVSQTKNMELRLTPGLIIALLINAGAKVPADAEVKFDVPSGGDYSGMTMTLEPDDCVRVMWKEETEWEDNDTVEVKDAGG